jgi:tetratricopeptide (TPR) repeat protein
VVERTRAILGVVAAAVAGVGAGGAPAHADGAGVVVVPAARGPATAADVTRAMVAATGADADAVERARRARAAGAVPAAELAGFAQVERLEAEGWRAYLVSVDAEFAASRLASARSQAEALLALPGGEETYAEVSLRLGLVLAHLGRREEAGETLRLAHALDRERDVTTAEFSPDAVAAYQAAIAVTPPTAVVNVRAIDGATLRVDGVDAGRAPASLPLAHGQHGIVARAPGHAAQGVAISVDGDTHRVGVTLETTRTAADRAAALSSGAGEVEAGAAVADTLVYAELDALLVVASVYRGGSPALLGQRCVLARPACTPIVEIGYVEGGLEAAARTLAERLDAADPRYGVLLPADPRVARGERGTRGGIGCRWCRNPWVLGGGGVVAAAVITTAAILLTRDDPVPRVSIDPGDFTE